MRDRGVITFPAASLPMGVLVELRPSIQGPRREVVIELGHENFFVNSDVAGTELEDFDVRGPNSGRHFTIARAES